MMSCSDSKSSVDDVIDLGGGGSTSEKSEEYYAGGKLGTTTLQGANAYKQPTPAVEQQGFGAAFQIGEALFERDFNTNTDGAFAGLGPLYVRQGCLYCHQHTVMASARSATDTQIWVTDTCWLSTTRRPTPTSTL